MASNDKKCLKEEIHKNVVLTGEYEFTEAAGHTATVHVIIEIGIFLKPGSGFLFWSKNPETLSLKLGPEA